MQQRVTAFQAEILDVKVTFVRPSDDSPLPYFKEGPIYGGPYQQMEAFLFFSKATMEYLKWSNKHPNILHIHDWHTCAIPLLYWDMYYQTGMCICVCVCKRERDGYCPFPLSSLCVTDVSNRYDSIESCLDTSQY